MAKRWACGILLGLGVASLVPIPANAQGSPGMAEPMPMNALQQMPGYGPMPTGYDPTNAGFPGMPMMTPEPGPGGMPGVGLPIGATYYPGISHDNSQGLLLGCLHNLFYGEDGERRQVYFHLGYTGLTRQSPRGIPLMGIEPLFPDGSSPIDGDGSGALDSVTLIHKLSSSRPDLGSGVRFGLGLQEDNVLYEAIGWYIARHAKVTQYDLANRLTSFYTNAPEGFQDTAGLWVNADRMVFNFANSLYSGELNVRHFGACFKTLDLNYLYGLRYVKLSERFRHITNDEINPFDPTTTATVDVRAENDLFGPQVGWSVTQRWNPTISMSWDMKIGLLANAAQTAQSLTRGDGFVGFDLAHTGWRLASSFETGLYLDLGGCNWRIRGGYDLKLFTGVATVENNFDSDFQVMQSLRNSSGSVLYYGPSASIEFVW